MNVSTKTENCKKKGNKGLDWIGCSLRDGLGG